MGTDKKIPKAETITFWNEIDKKMVRAGELILEGIRHPDCTPEMAAEMAATYKKLAADVMQTRSELRKIYPDTGTWTGRYPWNHGVLK